MPIDAISALLAPAAPAAECADVAQWWPRWRRLAAAHATPFERAVAGGADADRLGWAFASGYQAALRALDPSLPDDAIAALCVTEADGNFPRAIRTTLTPQGEGFSLTGEKRWTTLGPGGGLFVVIAREAGTSEERPALRAVRVASGTPGLFVEPMPPTSFVPEVPHARVRLEGVRVAASAVLAGRRRTPESSNLSARSRTFTCMPRRLRTSLPRRAGAAGRRDGSKGRSCCCMPLRGSAPSIRLRLKPMSPLRVRSAKAKNS